MKKPKKAAARSKAGAAAAVTDSEGAGTQAPDEPVNAQDFHDRLVALIKLVEPLVVQGQKLSKDIFPEGMPFHTEWPRAVRRGLDLGDDSMSYLYDGLSVFLAGDNGGTLLWMAERVRNGETFLREASDDEGDEDW